MSHTITILKQRSWFHRTVTSHGVHISPRYADFSMCKKDAIYLRDVHMERKRAAVVRVLPSLHAPEILPTPETKNTSAK